MLSQLLEIRRILAEEPTDLASLDQIQTILDRLLNVKLLDKTSSQFYQVIIGHDDDRDVVVLPNGTRHFISMRFIPQKEPAPLCYLENGLQARIARTYKDPAIYNRYHASIEIDGFQYQRELRGEESIWLTEEMFDIAFYPINFTNDGHGNLWRSPGKNLSDIL